MSRRRPRSCTLAPLALAALLVALATACSDSPTSSDPITISISPAQATVGAAGTLQLSATVSGTSNTQVNWTASAGTISGSGSTATFTAPAQGGSVTITARSQASADASATAQVTVTPAAVSVSPAEAELLRGETLVFTASVTGTEQTGVNWSASCGTVQAQGGSATFTAPDAPGSCTVTATSTLDSSRSGSASAATLPDWRITTLTGPVASCTPLSCSYSAGLEIANEGTGPTDPEGYSVLRFDEALAGQTLTYQSSMPTITGSVRVLGPAAAPVTLDANSGGTTLRRGMAILGGRVVAERIRVTNGLAQFGGGIVATEDADLVLRDVEIAGNTTNTNGGGGLRVSVNSRAHLERVTVLNNNSIGTSTPGAGVSVISGSVLTWVNGLIQGNTVEDGWGGGLHVFNAEVELTDVEIRDNRVLAGTAGGGGALIQGPARGVFDGVVFSGNQVVADANGGGARLTTAGLDVTIRNSRFENNHALNAGGLSIANNRVVVENSQFVGNEARGHSGGVAVFASAEAVLANVDIDGNVAGTFAGGIRFDSNAIGTFENVRIRDNQAQTFGGGIHALPGTQVSMSDGEISGNTVLGSWGGGIYNVGGSFTLDDVEILGNHAPGEGAAGGGVVISDGAELQMTGGRVAGNSTTFGGGLWARASEITLTGTEITDNEASSQGGGLQFVADVDATLREVTVAGNTAGEANGGGLTAFSNSRILLEESVVSSNSSATTGGGMILSNSEVAIVGTRIEGNEAATFGGGMLITLDATDVAISDSEIIGNSAGLQGGGIQQANGARLSLDRVLVAENEAEFGGAGLTAGGPATVRNSTFHANDGPATGQGGGGGILAASAGNLVLENVTLSANRAFRGGGLRATGPAALNGVTLFRNVATDEGGGILAEASGVITLRNTLVSGNTAGEAPSNCALGGSASIVSQGHNLSDDAACTPYFGQGGDANGVAAGLSTEIATNGGATPTHALLAGSPAINSGDAATCLPTDQRGYGRNGTCDIGAFEFEGIAPPTAPRLWGSQLELLPRVRSTGPTALDGDGARPQGMVGGVTLPTMEILR